MDWSDVNRYIDSLVADVDRSQLLLDTLRLTQPWTKAQQDLWMNTWEKQQDDKAHIRQLRRMKADIETMMMRATDELD